MDPKDKGSRAFSRGLRPFRTEIVSSGTNFAILSSLAFWNGSHHLGVGLGVGPVRQARLGAALAWPHQLRRRFRFICFDAGCVEPREWGEVGDLLPRVSHGLESLLSLGASVGVLERTELSSVFQNLSHPNFSVLKQRTSEFFSEIQHLLLLKGIKPEEAVFLGDGLAHISGRVPGGKEPGFQGFPELPDLEEATYCSLRGSSLGISEGMIHVAGSSDWSFQSLVEFLIEFIDYQADIWQGRNPLFKGPQFPTANPSWLIEQDGFDPSCEHEMESLFSIGNGFLGVRGSSDLPIPSSQSEFYVAGIYDQKALGFAYSEPEFKTEDRRDPFSEIVPFPFPLNFKFRVGDVELSSGLSAESIQMRGHERILDLKKGLLFEVFYFEVEQGGLISLRSLRMASLVDPHLLIQEIEIQAEGRSVDFELESFPVVSDFSLRYPHIHLISEGMGPPGIGWSVFVTSVSQFQTFIAIQSSLDGVEQKESCFRVHLEAGKSVLMRNRVSIFARRGGNLDEGCEGVTIETAKNHLLGKSWEAFDQEVLDHVQEWRRFWDKADARFLEKPAVTQAHRYGLYQLRSAAPRSGITSVGARGLTGRSYEGHIFWDAEIFMLPFYSFAIPEAAKNMLLYRYRTLSGARKRAANLGYRGACYAWESTVDGADVTPSVIVLFQAKKRVPILTGVQQIHVTADVAYAVCRYWEATQDDAFMKGFGVEILLETARFWASRVSEREGQFHILRVIGPDEYHHDVNDNLYTNWMARINLDQAVKCLGWLEIQDPVRWRELTQNLELEMNEIENWKKIARFLYIPQPNQEGVIEQFEGFFGLVNSKIESKDAFRAPVNRLLNWEEVNHLKLIKQADVLMIPFLFPDAWPTEIIESNFRYYAPLTDHGSSLSPCVHAAIAADIGLNSEANRYYEVSVDLDLHNLMQNTPLGIHLGCIGGTWQALVFHFLGLQYKEGRWIQRRARDRIQFPLGSGGVLLKGVA